MEHYQIPPGGDRNTGPTLKAIFVLFFSIAFILVNLRLYVRAQMVKKLWWDDFFLLLGLIFTIGTLGLVVASINSGFGRHIYYLSPKQILLALKFLYLIVPVFMLSCMFTRISICLFLLRIFMTNLLWKRALYIIMAFVLATGTASVITSIPQCDPIAKVWNRTINGTCWSHEARNRLYHFQGGVSIVADFLLAFLPVYFLKDLQISLRTKFSICALMSLGIFTGICAIVRTALVYKFSSEDFTYNSTSEMLWAGLEMNIATIAAAIPALRPLWGKSACQRQKNKGQVRWPRYSPPRNSICIVMDQQIHADPLSSGLETRIPVQQGGIERNDESKAESLPNDIGILKTNDISLENLQKFEGNWISENSGHSDRERSVEDVV